MKLRAHHNIIDLAEERRLREVELTDDLGFRVMFIGIRGREPEIAVAAATERRRRPKWLRTILGFGKRSRQS